jgi:parvulin-like peptidyl-prolyl isomerase
MAKKGKKAPLTENESASSEIAKKFKQNPGVYIGSVVVLVLVVVTFIGGDFLSGGRRYAGKTTDLTFGYYDKVPISWIPGNILSQYYEMTVYNFRAQGYDPGDRWINYYVWKQTYERTLVHTAILQMMKKSGYTPSVKAVDKAVLKLPQFQDSNGKFSLALFNRMSDSARIALWNQTQDELSKVSFVDDFYQLLVPESEAKFIANMSSPTRTFDFVYFKVDDYPESEFIAYARENSAFFNSIHLSKISVTSSQKEAQRILTSIKDGTATFEDAARAQSKDSYADRGGDMGIRYCYEIDGEIPSLIDREIIYRLGKGELSSIISTNDGWAFFRVEDELTQADFEDSSVLDRVRYYIRNYERGRMEDWAIEQARGFISESEESGYINASRWRNLERNSFGPLPLNYGGVELFTSLESLTVPSLNAQDLQGLSQNENFWKRTFLTPVNTPSEPLVQGNNVFVFIPTEEIEAEESSLETTASMYASSFVNYVFEQSLPKYFLNNGKTNDHFDDVYYRYFSQ